MAEIRVTIANPSGLHARPAARFVELASSFTCDILVKNITTDSKTINAKSILGILTLGVEREHEIQITATGADADLACQAIYKLVTEELVEIDQQNGAK